MDLELTYDELCCEVALQNAAQNASTMIFVHSRRKSVELARLVAERMPLCDFSQQICQKVKPCERGDLSFCLSRGVAFHNA